MEIPCMFIARKICPLNCPSRGITSMVIELTADDEQITSEEVAHRLFNRPEQRVLAFNARVGQIDPLITMECANQITRLNSN